MLGLWMGLGCPPVHPEAPAAQAVDTGVPSDSARTCGPAHEVVYDWEGGAVEARFGRADLALPAGVTKVEVSPEMSVHQGGPDQQGTVQVWMEQSSVGVGTARAVRSCSDWEHIGLRVRIRGDTLQLSSTGTFERTDRAARLRAAVVVPLSFTESGPVDALYGSVEDPERHRSWWRTTQAADGWSEVPVRPDPAMVADLFASSFAGNSAYVDYDFKPRTGRAVHRQEAIERPPDLPGRISRIHEVAPEDALTWTQVASVFDAHVTEIDACYERLWSRFPEARGKAPVKVAVGSDGGPLAVDVWGSWVGEPVLVQPPGMGVAQHDLEDCVQRAIWSWRFPDGPARIGWALQPSAYALPNVDVPPVDLARAAAPHRPPVPPDRCEAGSELPTPMEGCGGPMGTGDGAFTHFGDLAPDGVVWHFKGGLIEVRYDHGKSIEAWGYAGRGENGRPVRHIQYDESGYDRVREDWDRAGRKTSHVTYSGAFEELRRITWLDRTGTRVRVATRFDWDHIVDELYVDGQVVERAEWVECGQELQRVPFATEGENPYCW